MGWVPAPGHLRKRPPWWRAHALVPSLPRFSLPLPAAPSSACGSGPPSGRPPSQGIATGKYHAAVLTNSAEWEAACVKAGRRCGDLVHPLVYCPELHFSEFTSAVADMKNSVAVGISWVPARGGGAGGALPSGSPGDPKTWQRCG